jgi:hypothetical protein
LSPPIATLPGGGPLRDGDCGFGLGRRARIAANSACPVLLGCAAGLCISSCPCSTLTMDDGLTLHIRSYSVRRPDPGDRGVLECPVEGMYWCL